MSERASRGEVLAGVAGLVLILTMFLFAWFGLAGYGADAFDAYRDWLNIVLVFTAFAAISLAVFGTAGSRADLPLSMIVTVLGVVAAVIVFITILSPPGVSGSAGGVEIGIDFDRKFGVWLGLVSTIAIAVGGYMSMQEEGVGFGDAADRLGGGSETPTQPPASTPPPPPPPPAPPQQPPGGAA